MTTVESLQVAAMQCDLHWEDRNANLNKLGQMIQAMEHNPVDLVILPEMFTTGFTMNASQLAEETGGKTLDWMKDQASGLNAAITGSMIIREGGQFYNRLYFVYPNGSYKTYDKRHTFSYTGEDRVFSKGESRLVLEYKGWRICPLICYDLRFPIWSRNTEEIDLLIYVANWPVSRIYAWDTLLAARAIENLCYTSGVNRVGEDGLHIRYNGHSACFDPLGRLCSEQGDQEEGVYRASLEKKKLEVIRGRCRFLDDRDLFDLKI